MMHGLIARSCCYTFEACLLVAAMVPQARADGQCTPRPPTAVEAKLYEASYALFLRVAPKPPDGWTTSDSPRSAAVPTICREFGNAPIRRGFQRTFQLERGRQDREGTAMQAYTDMARKQQATQAANQAAIDAIDVKINALSARVQAAAAAQRVGEIDSLNQQMEALMQEKSTLMGLDATDDQAADIEADLTRDTDATFGLWFEVPRAEPRAGKPYRTTAGQGYVTAFDDKGNPRHDVHVYFGGAPEQAHVKVSGDPARVRALLDATDLAAIAAFR